MATTHNESYLRFVEIQRNHNTFVNYRVTLKALLQWCQKTYWMTSNAMT
jgi:hypothetical protein